MRVPIPWGRKRDGKRSECPKGNNMPAASERAMDEGGREGNIIFGHQGSSLHLETSSKYVNDSVVGIVEGGEFLIRTSHLSGMVGG